MFELKPVMRLEVTNLSPEGFLGAYEEIFRVHPIRLENGEVYPMPSKAYSDPMEAIASLPNWWGVKDEHLPGTWAEVSFDGTFLRHKTVSGRDIVYDVNGKVLTVDFGEDGSSTFAYQIIAEISPLLQPAKFFGYGRGGPVAIEVEFA